MKKSYIIALIIAGVFLVSGIFFAFIYQSANKSMDIYSSALKEYNNKNFQNAYYQFSKISFISNLKPYAIYRQALCAKELGDTKAELKQYQLLFNNYNNNKLSLRTKYITAQLLINERPKLAEKYFKEIIKIYPKSDYAIASEYYIGVITYNKFKDSEIFPNSEKNNIENAYRHYLKQAPQGRQALNAIINWLKLPKTIAPDDYLLMANSYYLYDDYENAKKMLTHTDLKDSWVLDIKNSYALKNYSRAKELTEYGLQNYAQYVDEKDIYEITDIYINMSTKKNEDINYLYSIMQPKGKDYIWSLKCDAVSKPYQSECYKNLYLNFPNSLYGANALANLFFDKIMQKDYDNAEKIGRDYLNKFMDTPAAPMIMFWLGKIAEHKNNYNLYMSYYKAAISKYPDSYYAYRAYIAMKHSAKNILNATIKEKPVVYPYNNMLKNDVIFKLVELQDYEILDIITDDEFIKSWIYYQKGDYANSALIARDAMDKLQQKPDKNDLRWRLVYPLNYYNEIKKYSTNSALMMALMREESYFNPNARSSVGARGLMQLMPLTAKEVVGVNPDDLYNPALNIRIGTNYYSRLRSSLNNYDISAVAAYNGGIGSINKWKNSINYNDTDEFVEQIPYSETKNYVKKVFRSYWNYVRIYGE